MALDAVRYLARYNDMLGRQLGMRTRMPKTRTITNCRNGLSSGTTLAGMPLELVGIGGVDGFLTVCTARVWPLRHGLSLRAENRANSH